MPLVTITNPVYTVPVQLDDLQVCVVRVVGTRGKMIPHVLVQLYEDLYWQNYDTMESNRIELAKQARREALQAAEAANKEEDLEMPVELQQGSGFFPGLSAKVPWSQTVTISVKCHHNALTTLLSSFCGALHVSGQRLRMFIFVHTAKIVCMQPGDWPVGSGVGGMLSGHLGCV